MRVKLEHTAKGTWVMPEWTKPPEGKFTYTLDWVEGDLYIEFQQAETPDDNSESDYDDLKELIEALDFYLTDLEEGDILHFHIQEAKHSLTAARMIMMERNL